MSGNSPITNDIFEFDVRGGIHVREHINFKTDGGTHFVSQTTADIDGFTLQHSISSQNANGLNSVLHQTLPDGTEFLSHINTHPDSIIG
ncbi:hypothetical protein [Methylobacterium nigriterrae]|uniref:hypothetical protein n=1 Tax=Methylobacterium nigriterrae TaxID=3127512 RepID=UPI00301366F0